MKTSNIPRNITLGVIVAFCLFYAVYVVVSAVSSSLVLKTGDPYATGFTVVEVSNTCYIVADDTTDVMYAVSRNPDTLGTMTLLANADGSPRLYSGLEV